MEKRTLIAFALSMAVLLVWFLVFNPKEEERRPEPRTTAPAPETPRPAESALKSATAPEGKAEQPVATVAPRARETSVTVDTPLYRAVFSNVGPSIVSLKLKNYRETIDADAPLIELAQLPRGAGEFLTMHFGATLPAGMEKVGYQAERERIEVRGGGDPEKLVFRATSPQGLTLTQTYRFFPDQYRIELTMEVLNGSDAAVEAPFLSRLAGLPPEKKSYYAYVGMLALLGEEREELEVKKPSEENRLAGNIQWVAYETDFFISAVVPYPPSQGSFTATMLPSGQIQGSYMSSPVSVNAGQTVSAGFQLYFGPRDLGILKELGVKLDRAVYFGWTDIIARPLLYVLRFFNEYLHNYGASIILLTILIKILFWPLTHKSYKSMKEMQKLQPRMAKLREKYKDNREQMNKELMGLYKTYKVNPMGGCLPMVIQIPVFFALFRILGDSIELRHAPFFLWINDLSAPDRLFQFPFSIPFMSPPYGIPMLTLLMGASMFLQQKMTPTPGDPTQAKIMMFLPVIFTFMFVNFSSGLVLYWLVNNILSIGQQYRINKSRT
jgi:YidC/Oxa1 family membrane protein insertase